MDIEFGSITAECYLYILAVISSASPDLSLCLGEVTESNPTQERTCIRVSITTNNYTNVMVSPVGCFIIAALLSPMR
jgi:hypothetical protein